MHCDVAIYPSGHSGVRVVIPAVAPSATGSLEHAKRYAEQAIKALGAIPMSEWRMTVTSRADVQDADPISPI